MEKNNIKPWYDTKQYNYVSLLQIMILINFLYFSYFISFDCIHSVAFPTHSLLVQSVRSVRQ